MKPKEKIKANFLYSKPLRARKIDLFYHQNILVDENLDICDQISCVLNEDGNNKRNESNYSNIYEKVYSSTYEDSMNKRYYDNHLGEKTDCTINKVEEIEDKFIEVSSDKMEDTRLEQRMIEHQTTEEKPPKPDQDHLKEDQPLQENTEKQSPSLEKAVETPKFSYKLPTLKNLFQPPYNISRPNFFANVTNEHESTTHDPSNHKNLDEDLEIKMIKGLPSIVQKVCDENRNVKNENKNLDAEIKRLRNKKSLLDRKLEDYEQEKDKLMCELRSYKDKYNELLEEVAQNGIYKKEIESYLKALREEFESIRIKQDKCNEDIEILRNEKNNLEISMVKHEKNAVLFFEKNNELEILLKKTNADYDSLKNYNSDLELKIESLKSNLERKTIDYENKVSKLENELLTLQKENNSKALEARNMDMKIEQVNVINKSLTENIKSLECENTTLNKKIKLYINRQSSIDILAKKVLEKNNFMESSLKYIERCFLSLKTRYDKSNKDLSLSKNRIFNIHKILENYEKRFDNQVCLNLKDVKILVENINILFKNIKSKHLTIIKKEREKHAEDIHKLKSQYSIKIRKIYKYYNKEEKRKSKDLKEEPADEDVWNVFK